MAVVSFYQSAGETPAALDALLPPLLEKVLKSGARALVVCPTESRASRLDETLWTFADASFLPHAMADAPRQEEHPILLTHAGQPVENLLPARTPLILSGAEAALHAALAAQQGKVLYMFTAGQADVARARPLYKELKEKGHDLQYWQQTATGWQKK